MAVTYTTKKSKLIIKNSSGNPILMHPETEAAQVTYSSSLSSSTTVKAELDRLAGLFGSADAMVFKGVVDGTTNTLPSTGYSAGWTYKVSVAGTYKGAVCEVGDVIVCTHTLGSSETADNSHWAVIQANVDGAVTNTDSTTQNATSDVNKVAIFTNANGTAVTGQGSRTIQELSTDHVYTAGGTTGLTVGTAGTQNTTITSGVFDSAYGQISSELSVNFAQVQKKLAIDTTTTTDSARLSLTDSTDKNSNPIQVLSLSHTSGVKTISVENSGSVVCTATEDTLTMKGTAPIHVKADANDSNGKTILVSADGMTGATPAVMSGDTVTTAAAAGLTGLVPAPAAGDDAKFLKGDGTWSYPASNKYVADTVNSIVITEGATTKGSTSYTVSHQAGYDNANASEAATPAITGTVTTGFFKFNTDSFGHVNAVTSVAKADINALISYWGTITCDGTSNNTISPSAAEAGLTLVGTTDKTSVKVVSETVGQATVKKVVVDRTVDCCQVTSMDNVPANLRDGGIIFLVDAS